MTSVVKRIPSRIKMTMRTMVRSETTESSTVLLELMQDPPP
jgi:hypothetical protein